MISINNKSITPLLIVIFNLLLSLTFIRFTLAQRDDKSGNISPDFRIIVSNESFIEIEFTPDFKKNYDFSNSQNSNIAKGNPDLKVRSFPLFFPTDKKNKIEILESRFEDIPGADILPVPYFRLSDKSKNKQNKSEQEYVPEYRRDGDAYSRNEFFPGNAAEVVQSGIIRNKYSGFLNIYPALFNPVSNTLRKYSYIKVRVTFNGRPVYSTKNLSTEERIFFRDVTLNSDIAAGWSTPEFNLQKDIFTENSVLASGDFYKIEIKESGIYKLDKSILQANSINVSNIDPRTIKIYGNGGAELPFNNSIPSPTDLVQNKIYVEGESDGRFDDNDFILFYGRSPNEWVYNPVSKTYFHDLNIYSKSNYYWITFGGANGLRMETKNSPSQPGLTPLPNFTDMLFEEPEINNPGSTGNLWVSQRISQNEAFTFNRELKGYVSESPLNMRFRFGNGSTFPEYWRIEDLNSNFIVNQPASGITGYSHVNLVYLNYSRFGTYYSLLPGKSSINFKASLPAQNGNSANVSGYYDFYEVLYKRVFSADNNLLRFNSPDTNVTTEYRINNFTSQSVKVFEISSPENVNLINPVSFSNGTLTFQSVNTPGSVREYYVSGNSYKTPVSFSARESNQNLKGELAEGSSFIILTPKEFVSAANRLKAQREKPGVNYLKTSVVEVEKIYNEFSGGLQDPIAIRNFLKYGFYNWQERPVYVLFMGDGSYDFKNIYNLYNNGVKNWLLPVEKDSETSDDVESYCSDDFLVEINENYPEPIGQAITDFATGRICVNSLSEANAVVDKIISYEDPLNFDKWRNNDLYVGDDGWTTEQTTGGEGSLHTDQCEDVAQNHTPSHIKKDKIYIVSYPSEITPQGRRKPGANTDIINSWNDGKLVINYTGHGSVDLWAHEHVFVRQISIPLLTNKNKYPFITIASCDLARWDDPFLISAGEQLVNLQDKGAIGVVAAVRPVYASQNAIFNNYFYDNLFKKDTLNLPLRSGKAMYNVKQILYSDNDLKYALVCDPTLRLGVPQHITRIDSINNVSGSQLFNMKALQKIKISGSILKTDSAFWNDYNGTLDIAVLDVDRNISINDFGYFFNFKLDGGIIYKGKVNVTNGSWTVDFVVPRDISYSPGRGKIISYFKNNYSDGVGYSNNFFMSGLDSTATADSTGPEIKIYMDNRNFRSGDLVSQNPKLIADFSDQSGINLTGTIGHKIEAVLNDDENNKIDLTALYTSTSGFQNGTVEYQMKNLPDGKYKLQLNAWDTYNNFSNSVIDFSVKSNSDLVLDKIYNYPNPMSDFTSFIFQHNSDSPLDANIRIYTVSGRLIKELNKTNITDKFVNIDWEGKDSDGDYIANGTYIYKITLKSQDGSFSRSSTGKLAKLK